MKKQFFFMLSALAIALPLSLSLQSCGDDDDDPQVTNTELSGGDTGNNGTGGNAPKAIDLGLPSGIKWASCNLGASTPEEYGDYYAWGETETKENYSWETYLTSLGATITSTSDCGTSKDPLRDYVYGGSSYKVATKAGVADGIGGTTYDVAHVKLGGKWRLPTFAEIKELLNNCTWTWTTQNGVKGRLVTSKTNGNSIFLPAAGDRSGTSLIDAGDYGNYWSSSPLDGESDNAYDLFFEPDDYGWDDYDRYDGHSVRPVSE